MIAARPFPTAIPKPTPAELGILRVLWRMGSATVREVHAALSEREDTGYTTVLKFLQIMHSKGLVERDASRRAHVYRPLVSQTAVQQQMTAQLVDRVFDGSSSKLVLTALDDSGQTTPAELAEIRAMLDRLEVRGG